MDELLDVLIESGGEYEHLYINDNNYSWLHLPSALGRYMLQSNRESCSLVSPYCPS